MIPVKDGFGGGFTGCVNGWSGRGPYLLIGILIKKYPVGEKNILISLIDSGICGRQYGVARMQFIFDMIF